MRRVLILFAASAFLPTAALITAAASGAPERSGSHRPNAGALSPARAADRQMLAYGEANPECRMWTNWEKLCARTGPGGSVHCSIDPDRRVTPSRPFCARRARVEPRNAPTVAERASAERYCARRATSTRTSRRQAEAEGRPTCARYDPARPFNGRRVAAWMRPGCDGLSDAETGAPLCVRGGDPGRHLPDCAALAATHARNDRLLACGGWSGPASCNASPVRSWSPPGADEITFGTPDPNRTAVHGLFCENQ